jgi:hypothetical protein
MYVVILSLYISNNMDSPVDVGGFAEPRKILCQCALPSFEQLSIHHRSNSLTIGIRAHGLKGCLILLKNKSCQNCVLTIPLCRGGRDEATVENRVEIGRRKPSHAPSRAGEETAHVHRRAPRVTHIFFARMG